jgi:hypothetical protein
MNDFGELLIFFFPAPLHFYLRLHITHKIYGMPIHRLSDRIKGSA